MNCSVREAVLMEVPLAAIDHTQDCSSRGQGFLLHQTNSNSLTNEHSTLFFPLTYSLLHTQFVGLLNHTFNFISLNLLVTQCLSLQNINDKEMRIRFQDNEKPGSEIT